LEGKNASVVVDRRAEEEEEKGNKNETAPAAEAVKFSFEVVAR
jgi:hypothetical protein